MEGIEILAVYRYRFLFSGYTFDQEQSLRKIRKAYPVHIFAEYITEGLTDNFDVFKYLQDI
jgi:hypothetical protein